MSARRPSLASVLASCARLEDADRAALDGIAAQTMPLARNHDVMIADQAIAHVPVVTEGWLATYHMDPDGRAALMSLHLPGDVIDLGMPASQHARYAVQALTPAEARLYPIAQVRAKTAASPRIAFAFMALAARQYERALERGRILSALNAYQRLAHLCLDLLSRLERVELARDNTFPLPLNQPKLGRYLGMHEVHVNRTFKRLETDGWLSRTNGHVKVHHREALARLVEYRPVDGFFDAAPAA